MSHAASNRQNETLPSLSLFVNEILQTKLLTAAAVFCIHTATSGAVAQLGERLNGIQEVSGSTPLSSTRKIKGLREMLAAPFSLTYLLLTPMAVLLRIHQGASSGYLLFKNIAMSSNSTVTAIKCIIAVP